MAYTVAPWAFILVVFIALIFMNVLLDQWFEICLKKYGKRVFKPRSRKFLCFLILYFICLSCFNFSIIYMAVRVSGIDTIYCESPQEAKTTGPLKQFLVLPVTTNLSEVRNHNFTIMNFEELFHTYNWSKTEPFDPSGKVGKSDWYLQVWNMPEEKIHLEMMHWSGDAFYKTSFYELKLVNRDTGNVTFKESGFGVGWGHLLVTKDCLEKSLDKEGSLHIMMSFALNGTKQDIVKRIKDEEGIKITYPTAKPIKKPKGMIPSNYSISSNYSIRGAKLAGGKNGTSHASLAY